MEEQIRYYSTNRSLGDSDRLTSFEGIVSFKEALFMGQAPDEGLFMPTRIPQLSMKTVRGLQGASYADIALLVAEAFLKEEISTESLSRIVESAYDFPVPLERVYDNKYLMRLDRGPTASFKDFAARMMARLMSHLRDKGKRFNILVATSGDTGGAVGEAFKGVSGVSVYILYPAEEVSGRQKKQLDTIGANVQAISVAGKFDDCQNLVKQAFSDVDFSAMNLTSANSINFGRILPQIIYYVYAYAQLTKNSEDIVFSVPSGNFGDALGCEYARRMGLPVKKLLVPTNANDEFPRFLQKGLYEKVSPSRACLSNAMNVGHPSNLARFFELYGGTVDKNGMVHKYPDIDEMRRRIFSVSVSDEETRQTIKEAYDKYAVVLEPHGAVGWKGLEAYLKGREVHDVCVCLETAHPAKFPEQIMELLKINPEVPPSLRDIDTRQGEPFHMANDYEDLKNYLLKHLVSRDD